MRVLKNKGFTLVELCIVMAIIGFLAGAALPRFATLILRAKEGQTKGNLATIRSAVALYYGDNEGLYPVTGNLTPLLSNTKYLTAIPNTTLPSTPFSQGHPSTNTVDQSYADDNGGWYYNNQSGTSNWGQVYVSCTHSDVHGIAWTFF